MLEMRGLQIALVSTLGAASISIAAGAAELDYPSYMWEDQTGAPYVNSLSDSFESANPGLTVKRTFVPFSEMADKFYIEMTAGSPPDILTTFDTEVRRYVDADLLEPLDSYLEEAGWSADDFLAPGILTKDGKIYAVANSLNPRALWINTALLEEAGVAPPTNLDEFYGALKALRIPDKQQFGFGLPSKPGEHAGFYKELAPIIIGFGTDFTKDGKPNATAPETVDALRFYKKVYDEGLIPKGTDYEEFRRFFMQRKVAMMIAGPWVAARALVANPAVHKELGAIPLPFPGKQAVTVTEYWSVPKNAPNKEAAIRFILTMLQDEWQAKVATVVGAVPARRGTVPKEFLAENPWFSAFSESAMVARPYAPDGAEQYGSEIAKIVVDHIEGMLFRDVSAEETAERLQSALTKFLEAKAL